jgi:glycine cleavage system protein P-like pyridoxal-binding family
LPDTDWSFAHIEESLYEEFTEISSKARVEEFKKMNKALEKQIESELADPIALELNRPQKEMWHRVIENYQSTVSGGEELLVKKSKSMGKECFLIITEDSYSSL